MFASVRWCAEPITHLCWLKVKDTIEGHQFEPWILRPLHCHSDCLVKFGSTIHRSEMMCRTHNSAMQTQGQGHSWRPPVWALNFEAAPLSFCGGGYSCPSDCLVKVTIEGHLSLSCLLHISWTLWKIFMKLWSNVCLSEAMCRTHNSSMLTQGQGHS